MNNQIQKLWPASVIALCGAVLIATPGVQALDPAKAITQYHQDIWTERDGLPQGTVQAITQTRDGYLWIGTRDGLARFDGVTFTVFRAETHPGLPANDIRALFEDTSGQLWVGTFNGGLSRYAGGKFTCFTSKDGLPSNGVLSIFQTRRGDLWFGTWNGLARFRAGKFVAFGKADGLVGQNGWSIQEDRQGQLWVASEAALHRFKRDRFEALTSRDGLPESALREVYIDRNDAIWVVTIGSGLCCLRDGKVSRWTDRDGLPDNKVQTVLEDANGNIWIGTWSGLCRWRAGQFSAFTKQDGLPHDYVEVLYEDREGSLWIGTRGGGLARLRDGKFSNYTTREGLAHNFAKFVFEDGKGVFWIGTHGGGLSRSENGRFTNFGTGQGLRSHFVWAIAEDRAGNIWVGTGRPAGLHLFQDGTFKSFGKLEGLPISRGVRAIFSDREGNLWMGGDGGGLCRYRDGKFSAFTVRDGLPSNLIRVIGQDREGDLWIGTNDGLGRYRQGQFQSYTKENGLAHNAVYAIYQDSEGVIWFGTQGGLTRLADGRFRSYTTRDGLFQNVIYQILEDGEQNLWMSSNRGIFSVSKRAFADFDQGRVALLACVSYGVADGMKASQCEGGTQPAGWKSRDGKLWFPTANGVTMINPENIRRNPQPPPVLIEHVVVGQRSVPVEGPAEFSPDSQEIRFHYTALSFLAPDKVRFRYRLEGLDKTWVEAEARRVAAYNKIPPGRYRFRVSACNNDGIWNEAGASFAFYLRPHFYQTAWFYGLCAATVALGAWSFHRRRMRQAEAQFSLVLAERSRIARDLHDTLAQGFAGIAFQLEAVATKLTEAPAQAQQHLNLALNMVRHSLSEARRSVMNLRSAALEKGDLGTALAETARQVMAGRPVEVQLQTLGSTRPLPAKVESNLLRVGQEAITNALRHSQAGNIVIEIDYRRENVLLRIRDDGQGFDLADPARVQGGHFGLLGMRERAKQMGARLDINSRPGRGTEVELEVPLN